ncbi:phage tail protein, partial [Ilumatobacter sp.]|nr:phage tail protein [Ilumatobacter sp.]
GAFPVKWTGPSFSASSTDMAEEQLEIAHHGFRARDV